MRRRLPEGAEQSPTPAPVGAGREVRVAGGRQKTQLWASGRTTLRGLRWECDLAQRTVWTEQVLAPHTSGLRVLLGPGVILSLAEVPWDLTPEVRERKVLRVTLRPAGQPGSGRRSLR